MKRTSAIAIVMALAFASPALAGDKPPFLGTGGYVSMNTDHVIAVDFHMPFGDDLDVFGFVPELLGQIGLGPAAIGVDLGMAVAVPDEGDTEYYVGNIGVFGKGGYCFTRGIHLCIGGQLEVSLAPFEAKDRDWMAIQVGNVAHFRVDRFGTEMIVVSPTVGAELKMSMFWAQGHLGLETFYWYGCPDGQTCDEETFVTFGVAGGVTLFDLLNLGAGFRVHDHLTGDNVDAAGVFDIIAKLSLGPIEPGVVLAFPLDKDTRKAFPASMSAGIAGRW